MTELREAGEISTGELLDGRYRLDERIGEGGMARVYRAEDTILGRTVAVKVLRAPVDELGAIQRARSETALLASLNHHGLVTLFDARVSEDDISYLVMELVEGITLRERIARGPLAPAEAASLTIDIAEALHVAHTAGIVHRDIKPSNVLLWKSPLPGREWRAKLADFGIAYLLDSSRVTTPGLMVGTVAYIAPEQARGAPPAPAADIYALGLMMIEALTGTRPFADAEGIGTVMARLANAPAVPDSLDVEWQRLLRWMTATRPEERPNALEVAVAASRLLPGAAPTSVDESTAAVSMSTIAAAAAVGGADAATARTALLPLDAATGATVAMPSAEPSAAPTASRSPAGSARRRRSAIATAVVSGVVLISAIVGGAVWSSSPFGSPEPVPSQPSEEFVVTDPDVQPTPAVEDSTPTEEPAVEPADTGNSGSGTGAGNGNTGPGNNNGKGKGKGGKDK